MELIPNDSIFEFNADTLQYLRKQYDLDKPGRIEESINLLDDWIQKQPHFRKKDFSKDYLERTIIIAKGSVERAKKKLDNICTFRTLYPELFGIHDIKNFQSLNDLPGGFLPKLTPDHYRVFVLKNKVKSLDKSFIEFYQYFSMQCEYIQARDYCNGLVSFFDVSEANIMEVVKASNIADMQKCLAVVKDGYGKRVKGMHFYTHSKTIDVFISLCKKAFGPKIGERIVCHTSLDTLYNYIPRDILPVEYGGKEKSIYDIHKNFLDEMTSKDFTDHLIEINKACTDESLRPQENLSMGIPGSFRMLSVD